jgi:16S rRNA (uracil1498-N3)-methyltransferase
MQKTKAITEYYFYADAINDDAIILSKEELSHINKVLRIRENTRITLTDGLGLIAEATISGISNKGIDFEDIEVKKVKPLSYFLTIAIAPTKNISRFEWFIEKATEIGISVIQPILTEHSERKHVRHERLEKVAISAMKQSKKAWKPNILPILEFKEYITGTGESDKYMAYLGEKSPHLFALNNKLKSSIVLIGPEGGFSEKEYATAKANNFQSVSLGNSRLRTETAGIVATQIISMKYDKI